MSIQDHLRTTGTALHHWIVAQVQDCLIVGALWLVGLLALRIHLAPLWALIGGLAQFIPNFGPLIALIGPTFTLLFSHPSWSRFLYLLVLYALIAVLDGLVLQPYLMRRSARVPIWASIVVPIALGIVIPFWGVLLAPPLLAIFYTFREKHRVARSTVLHPKPSEIVHPGAPGQAP